MPQYYNIINWKMQQFLQVFFCFAIYSPWKRMKTCKMLCFLGLHRCFGGSDRCRNLSNFEGGRGKTCELLGFDRIKVVF